MKYELAIFDLDGTLIDSMGIWKDMASQWFIRHHHPVPENLETEIFSMTFLDAARYCLSFLSADMTPEELLAEWSQAAKERYQKDLLLKPYTTEILSRVKEAGMKISLTTSNFRDVAVETIDRLGIARFFDSITVTQEVARSKYFPDVYLLAAKKLNISPERCIVFEDSYYSIHGAKAAGMYVIGVYDSYSKYFRKPIENLADRYILSFENILSDPMLFHSLEGV
jgi:HAD superfamily hydrolase (TIGR01509 family)